MKIDMLKDEHWWGGAAVTAPVQPFDATTEYECDLLSADGNQSSPLLVSDKGRYVWSEHCFKFKISGGRVEIFDDKAELYEGGETLRDAYLAAMKAHFPFSGKVPPEKFFATAQYNTWMEFTYNPTQKTVLDYARSIIESGYEPGILIIDEGWHTRYGVWEFDFAKFPDPKAMIDELHEMGFTVMLWVVPLMTADGRDFLSAASRAKFLNNDGRKLPLLKTDSGNVALVEWWNGYSAILNMCDECDRDFLDAKLRKLMSEYGVDGFKFDGGSLGMYDPKNVVNGEQTRFSAEELNIAWNEFGERYEFHEYKDSFKRGGAPVIQRIRDRGHRWDGDGLCTLLPFAFVEGLTGYPFLCPDMIGGGEWSYTLLGKPWDEELVVRMAECSALFPMMQFSLAPWRILSEKNADLCLKAAKLHKEFAPRIIEQVKKAAASGEPVIRPLEYVFPAEGFNKTKDAFMLGEDVLVAPVIEQGAVTKTVRLPRGKWLYLGKTELDGGTEVTVDAPLGTLPYFIRK